MLLSTFFRLRCLISHQVPMHLRRHTSLSFKRMHDRSQHLHLSNALQSPLEIILFLPCSPSLIHIKYKHISYLIKNEICLTANHSYIYFHNQISFASNTYDCSKSSETLRKFHNFKSLAYTNIRFLEVPQMTYFGQSVTIFSLSNLKVKDLD